MAFHGTRRYAVADPNAGYCHLCAAPLTPGHLDAILDHVRVLHPDAWRTGSPKADQ